ncbi:MAG: hypothetical protein IH577_04450, partial [Deltaproteobacteria bacterium]|nr:hypothetical protein [Deltaproteobacteria bacterium]
MKKHEGVTMPEGRWVSTWKQIGKHLGCSAKSAKRKAKRGLPVHYDGPIPTAYTLDLDEWR